MPIYDHAITSLYIFNKTFSSSVVPRFLPRFQFVLKYVTFRRNKYNILENKQPEVEITFLTRILFAIYMVNYNINLLIR